MKKDDSYQGRRQRNCCGQCGRPGYVDKSRCDKCIAKRKTYVRRESGPQGLKYEPIDEILAKPKTRLMRLLARNDWMHIREIFEYLEVDGDRPRDNMRRSLIGLVDYGLVDTRGGWSTRQYRLTLAGRDDLACILDNQYVEMGEYDAAM